MDDVRLRPPSLIRKDNQVGTSTQLLTSDKDCNHYVAISQILVATLDYEVKSDGVAVIKDLFEDMFSFSV
jgi:hypothetical protein